MKLYGINTIGHPEMESTEVKKETASFYYTKRRLSWYSFKTQILKDDDHLCFSEKEAIDSYIKRAKRKVADYHTLIEEIWHDVNAVRRMENG
jgi:hypothetical protein